MNEIWSLFKFCMGFIFCTFSSLLCFISNAANATANFSCGHLYIKGNYWAWISIFNTKAIFYASIIDIFMAGQVLTKPINLLLL